ncbi:response regulator transcription factor, partial [Adlercreutzia equolifaciens]
ASSREGVKAEGVLDFPVPSGVPDGLSTVVPDNVRRLADDCGLTEREKEILALFAEGRSVPYIAEKFILSPNTVKTHMRRIYGKANVHSRQELLDKLEEIGR